MKKAISLILALAMCLSLCACGDDTQAETKATTEPTETTEPAIAREVEALAHAVNYIKGFLKDPNSIEVHKVRYTNDTEKSPAFYYYEIDYSAKNSLGGAVRETIYISVFVPVTGDKVGNDGNFIKDVQRMGIDWASERVQKKFNEQIACVKKMDKISIQKAMEMI